MSAGIGKRKFNDLVIPVPKNNHTIVIHDEGRRGLKTAVEQPKLRPPGELRANTSNLNWICSAKQNKMNSIRIGKAQLNWVPIKTMASNFKLVNKLERTYATGERVVAESATTEQQHHHRAARRASKRIEIQSSWKFKTKVRQVQSMKRLSQNFHRN